MLSPTDLDVNSMADCLPNWPSGPLNDARNRASFDWREMKLILDGDEVIRFKHKVWSTLKQDPLFARTPWEELTRNEERKITFQRLKRLTEFAFASEEDYTNVPHRIPAFAQAIGQFSWSLIVKRVLSYEYFIVSCKMDYHDRESSLINDVVNFNALGAISITELAHGSNTKELRTTATFDPKSQEFILNTPDLEATKVWSGVLGQSATHAVVFAQLYTPDGKCHGLHNFMVPVRDPRTLQPFKNIVIGDMGGKIGLNGLDNGFMNFNNYRIPKGALMNRSSEITADGRYLSKVKDESKRFGVTLGILSSGRIFIILFSLSNLQSALTISVRYSALRKQFGPNNDHTTNGGGGSGTVDQEWPVIDYQTQQWRLIPYIAASYVLQNFFGSLFLDYVDFFVTAFNAISDDSIDMGSEIHSLSSCGKAVASWLARDAIQESRECCGGHGYLKASGLGELRNDHDANNTYEGDNNVLLQQTSNYLIKFYREKVDTGKPIHSYFGSVNYIDSIELILSSKQSNELNNLENTLNAYQYLVCYLLRSGYHKMIHLNNIHNDLFVAKSNSQVYHLRTLAIVFFECEAISRFNRFLKEFTSPPEIDAVLHRLGLLYSLWSLEKHFAILVDAGYFVQPIGKLASLQNTILELCTQLKDDAVTLVDSYAPPDHILNSSLGCSDGKIYENIFDALAHNRGAFERPEWYREFTENNAIDAMISKFKPKL